MESIIENLTIDDIGTLARTIYGEARGEYEHPLGGLAALIAVANIVINRLKKGGKYGKTVTEVCQKPKQFSCWNHNDPNRSLIMSDQIIKSDLFQKCFEVAHRVSVEDWPDLTHGSDHYHAKNCHPSWASDEKRTLTLGNHIFYRLDKQREEGG